MSYKDKKVKRKLKKISFDFDKAHLAYTDSSAGGACSLVNEPILLKSLEEGKELSIEQQSLLEAMGYDINSVAKSMENQNTPSLSSSEGGEGGDKLKIEKGNNNPMSEEILKEMAQLRKALAVSKLEKELTKYSLSAEIEKELSEALAEVEGKEAVFKAFDALIEAGEANVAKALEEAKEAHTAELEKAKSEASGSDLAKTLEKEAGEAGKPEGEVEKSRTERVAKYLDKNKEGK